MVGAVSKENVSRALQNSLPTFVFGALFVALIFAVGLASASAGEDGDDRVGNYFSYVSPRPDAEWVPAATTIALRPAISTGAELIKTLTIAVKGSLSGVHEGKLFLAGDLETIIFEPHSPFNPREEVTVLLDFEDADSGFDGTATSSFKFFISPPIPEFETPIDPAESYWRPAPLVPTGDFITSPYVTAPSDLPLFKGTAAESGIANGFIFISLFEFSGQIPAYQLILDNDGEPIYYNRFHLTFDYKVQPNGHITYYDPFDGHREFYEIDNNYQVIKSYDAGNGYDTDNHDLQLLEDGHALIMADSARVVDLRTYGGEPDAIVVGCVVQELDESGNVIFQWDSWDYIPANPNNTYADLTVSDRPIRYVHCNSIELDDDGNILISSRHLQEVTKINRTTGNIKWRLGGKKNQFTFVNDDGFHWQHDARRLDNGNLTVYDNRTDEPDDYSRAVEYTLDEQNKIATFVREYRNAPDSYGAFMGNFTMLPNGNHLFGWGTSSDPLLTEMNDADEIVFQLSTNTTYISYRAFRLPWEGIPTWSPFLVSRQDGPVIRLFFSWNGSTETASYAVYGKAGFEPADLLAIVPRDGFESVYEFSPPEDGPYTFKVVALDSLSIPLADSNESSIMIGGLRTYLPLTFSSE